VRYDGRTVPVQLGKGKRRFKLNFTGDTGVIAPVELKYQIGKDPGDYGRTYNLGGYDDLLARADLANPKIFHEGLRRSLRRGDTANHQGASAYRWAGALRRLYRERPEHRDIQE
jgi:hypothetical protein